MVDRFDNGTYLRAWPDFFVRFCISRSRFVFLPGFQVNRPGLRWGGHGDLSCSVCERGRRWSVEGRCMANQPGRRGRSSGCRWWGPLPGPPGHCFLLYAAVTASVRIPVHDTFFQAILTLYLFWAAAISLHNFPEGMVVFAGIVKLMPLSVRFSVVALASLIC